MSSGPREIEIRDPSEFDRHNDHELVLTRVHSAALSHSNMEGFTTSELCQLYVAIEERLRGLGFSRVRMLKVAQIASSPGPAQQS